MHRALALLTSSAALAGCSGILGEARGVSYYTIQHEDCVVDEGSSAAVVEVSDFESEPFLNGARIVFSRSRLERGFYQFSNWSKSPPEAVSDLLRRGIECDSALSLALPGVAPDIMLHGELIDFRHDIESEPGVARVEIKVIAELSDRSESRYFRYAVAVPDFSAAGAVQAFSQATTQFESELLQWLKEQVLSKTPA